MEINSLEFSLGMCRVWKVIRKELGSDFPSQHLAALLDVAAHPDSSVGDIGKRLGMPSSTVSRTVSALSTWSWTKKEGHGLIQKTEDIYESRRKLVNLTQEGKHLVKLLHKAYIDEEE